jgi:hypothetical protein
MYETRLYLFYIILNIKKKENNNNQDKGIPWGCVSSTICLAAVLAPATVTVLTTLRRLRALNDKKLSIELIISRPIFIYASALLSTVSLDM